MAKGIMVRTPKGVAAFTHVHAPDTEGKYADGKYKTDIVFDLDADLSKVEDAARRQAAVDFPKMKPEKVNVLIKDGDERVYTANSKAVRDGEAKEGDIVKGFEGKRYVTAKTKYAPQIIGPDKQPLPAGTEIRSGDIVIAVLAPFGCDKPVKGSVTFRLQALQLVEKRAGGGHDYSDLFDDEGEGFGGETAEASTGAESGIADDDEIPF